jgi:NAD(P)-dependent dehydrogenase (short-subunit alcohol dehydrogenase family)
MTQWRFEGRTVIVTGSGSGLGEVYARLLADRGAFVVVTDLGASADAVAGSIVADGGRAMAVRADVTSEADAERIVAAAVEATGRVDGLVNNAGIGFERPMMETSLADMRKVLDVHLFGTVHLTRAVWPHMARVGYGRILNITSANIFGLPGWSAYAAAKAANLSFGRTVAFEGAPFGIHVNIMAPAALTAMLTDNIKDPEILASVQGAKPELCAPLAAYLVHEDNPFNARAFFNGSGHVSDILMGTTAGQTDTAMTIERVAEILADPATHEGFTAHVSTVEQSGEQAA